MTDPIARTFRGRPARVHRTHLGMTVGEWAATVVLTAALLAGCWALTQDVIGSLLILAAACIVVTAVAAAVWVIPRLLRLTRELRETRAVVDGYRAECLEERSRRRNERLDADELRSWRQRPVLVRDDERRTP